MWKDLSYDLFDKNDYVLSDPGFDGFPALNFHTIQHNHHLKGKMAVTPIGQRFEEDDCKCYKMSFVEALLIFFLSTGRKKIIFYLTNGLWFTLKL